MPAQDLPYLILGILLESNNPKNHGFSCCCTNRYTLLILVVIVLRSQSRFAI